MKFTPKNGKIKIKVQLKWENDRFQIVEKKPYLVLHVIDNGIGIKKTDKSKIFKLFGCIKDEKNHVNTKGIGLGLVISKMIVDKFNGTINFKSKFNRGSVFFFDFQIEQF